MQLSVNTSMPGLQRGMPIGPDLGGIVTRFNARSETRTVTITYDATYTHTLQISGIPVNGGASQQVTIGPITGDTDSATTAAAIKTAIEASAVADSIVAVTRSSNVLTLVARRAGTLTVSGSVSGGSAATTVATTVTEEQLEAGVAVVRDSTDKYIRKPHAGTAQVATITPTAANSTIYTLMLDCTNMGYGVQRFTVTSDSDGTAAEVVTAFAALINASPIPITASGTGTLILTSDWAGVGFTVQEVDSNLAVAATTPNVGMKLDGITLWPKVEDSSQSLSSNNVWPARFDVMVMRRGRIGAYVEEAVTPDSTPHYRKAANGSLTVLGAFRTDRDGGTALPADGCQFLSSASAGGVAEMEINLP
jgi:hypothetical protein